MRSDSVGRTSAPLWGLLVWGLLVSQATNAALVTETWRASVTGFDSVIVGLTIGQTFDWSITYDASGRVFNRYSDGTNGDGENGGGDDTLDERYCMDAQDFDLTCRAQRLSDTRLLLSDATFSFVLPAFTISNYGTALDFTDTNERAVVITTAGQKRARFRDDDRIYNFLRNRNGNTNDGRLTTHYRDNSIAPGPWQANIEIINTLVSATGPGAPVPVPFTAALLLLGLLGIGMSRRSLD